MRVADAGSGTMGVADGRVIESAVGPIYLDTANPRRTGFDHMGFKVDTRAALDEWLARFEQLGVSHSPIAECEYGAVLTFKTPTAFGSRCSSKPTTHSARTTAGDFGILASTPNRHAL
jgi:hypothetical protein